MRSRVLANLHRHRAEDASNALSHAAHAIWAPVLEDVYTVQNGWQVTNLAIGSPRRYGGAVVKAKQMIQRALHPLPARQTEYNLAVDRILTHLLEVTARQAATIERLQSALEEHEERRHDT